MEYIVYLGVVVSLLSTIFLTKKNPWKSRKWKRIIYKPSVLGILLLVVGSLTSMISTHYANKESEIHNELTSDIYEAAQTSLKNYKIGLDKILSDHKIKYEKLLEDYKFNSEKILNSIIENSDSTLKSKIRNIKREYTQMEKEFSLIKDAHDSYYKVENWPVSIYQDNDSISMILWTIFIRNEVY